MMKRIFSIAICLLLLLSLSLPVQAADAVPKPVMQAVDSVVRIFALYSDEFSTGTGFVIQSDRDSTLIATNYHVVDGNPESISIWLGEENLAEASILVYSEQQDLCVLSIPYATALEALTLSGQSAKQGSAVYAVGFPGAADDLSDRLALTSADATITDGIVSAIRNVTITEHGNPVTLLQINAAINSGNSGGPLFNASGKVVGINTYGTYDSQGINGAIDVKELRMFLAVSHISIGGDSKAAVWIGAAALCLAAIAAAVVILMFRRKGRQSAASQTQAAPVSLRAYMAEFGEGMGISDAVSMLLPVALRLRDLHQDGVLHLQISPDSVFVGPSGGILGDTSPSETARYTSGYAAPEIYSGKNTGHLSDQYSFCAILYYAATGKQPGNALSRAGRGETGYPIDWEGVQADDGFVSIMEKGMAISPEDRFPSIQELILHLAPYHVKPFTYHTYHVETTLPDGEPEKKARKEKAPKKKAAKKHHLSKKASIAIAASVVVLVVGGYVGSYFGALTFAKKQDFTMATRFLFLPALTRLHDSSLTAYVEAGCLMTEGQYQDAAEEFRTLPGYLDADAMAMEADYGLVLQYANTGDFESARTLMEQLVEQNYEEAPRKMQDLRYQEAIYQLYEEKDFETAYKAFKQLDKEAYPGAKDMACEALYQWAMDLILNEKYAVAYHKLNSIRDYSDVQETLKTLADLMYAEAQKLYRKGEYAQAEVLFSCIPSHKDSQKYLTLIGVHLFPYDVSDKTLQDMIKMFNFGDTSEVLLLAEDIGFLRGKWSGDGHYFTMNKDGYINYNLPASSYGNYYRLEDGYILFYPANDWVATKKIFHIEALSPDCIEVYCYQNGQTYTLYRQ